MPSTMARTMLAVGKPEAAPGAEIREVQIPSYGPGDVLVKVKIASICGTDLHIYNWDRWAQKRIHPPLIPGHEFCGEVAAFGGEVTSVKAGDCVSAEMQVGCGKCREHPPQLPPVGEAVGQFNRDKDVRRVVHRGKAGVAVVDVVLETAGHPDS